GRQSALDPIVAGDARAQRHARRHDRAHRPRDFEGIAHARGERAAITVATLVGDRRKEAVQEIAVRRVQLDGVDAGADRTFGGIDEAVAHALHVRRRHLSRHRPIGAECNGGWGDRLPGVLSWCKRLAALPWPSRGGLRPAWASWMPSL